MGFRTEGMRFRFEGKRYIANMTPCEISGNGRYGSPGNNIPIKLPDGRFVRVNGWRRSSPPKPCGVVVINGNEIEKYGTAELIEI